MTTLLTTLMVIGSFIIVAAVLLQPAKGGAMGPLGGGGSQSIFGSGGATSFLFKLTMWTAAFIMVASIFLSRQKIQDAKTSVIDASSIVPPHSAMPAAPTNTAPGAATTPAQPAAPAAGSEAPKK